MKIKKKELRRGEAQLPINYPDPEVVDAADFCFDAERTRVEELCKRLAHNEVAVRDAVLAALPQYIRDVTRRLAAAEAHVDAAALRRFMAMRREGDSDGRAAVNVLRELDAFRSREENMRREQRRQAALQRLQQQQLEAAENDEENEEEEEEEAEEDDEGKQAIGRAAAEDGAPTGRKSLRQVYRDWVSVWGEVELLLLKLSRGIFFCMWHSDKPLVQLACAQRIAELIHAPHTNSGKILMFSCIMRVLGREWRTMDRYRVDKFLALVRKMIYELVTFLKTLECETRQQQQKEGSSPGAVRKSPSSKRASSAAAKNGGSNMDNDKDVLSHDPLCRALDEACYVFQSQVVPDPTAVGLTMHVCDVLFDELCRAAVSPSLFVELSDRVGFYAMSQGNFVEKRVLDYFVAPIAGGMLLTRRREQHQQHEPKPEGAAVKGRKRQHSGSDDDKGDDAKADAETHAILLALADVCKHYAVARRTVRPVRVMFTESELALRQAADPAATTELSRGAVRRRIEREVADVDETRHAVIEERRNMRVLRQQEKRKQLREQKKKRRMTADEDEGEDEDESNSNDNNTRTARRKGGKTAAATGKTKVKKVPRNTKRKKYYTLTKEDLYGDE